MHYSAHSAFVARSREGASGDVVGGLEARRSTGVAREHPRESRSDRAPNGSASDCLCRSNRTGHVCCRVGLHNMRVAQAKGVCATQFAVSRLSLVGATARSQKPYPMSPSALHLFFHTPPTKTTCARCAGVVACLHDQQVAQALRRPAVASASCMVAVAGSLRPLRSARRVASWAFLPHSSCAGETRFARAQRDATTLRHLRGLRRVVSRHPLRGRR